MAHYDLSDDVFASRSEDFDLRFSGHPPLPRMDFRLGSLRLCGSDFVTRWSRDRWAARQIAEAVARNGRFFSIRYGASTATPESDPRSHASYLERLEHAGRGKAARPDFLIVPRTEDREAEGIVSEVGGSSELPFLEEDDPRLRRLLDLAILAVACESAPARAESALDDSRPSRLTDGAAQRSGSPEAEIRPSVVFEREGLDRLCSWQHANEVPIHIWQVFFDSAFGVRLDRAREAIDSGLVEPAKRLFQTPGGACTERALYEIPHHYGYRLGRMTTEPVILADSLRDENGQILPYVRFEGGGLQLTAEATHLLAFPGDASDSP